MTCVKQAGLKLGVVFQSAPATLVLSDHSCQSLHLDVLAGGSHFDLASEGKMGLRIDSNFPFLFSMALRQSRSDHICTAK